MPRPKQGNESHDLKCRQDGRRDVIELLERTIQERQENLALPAIRVEDLRQLRIKYQITG